MTASTDTKPKKSRKNGQSENKEEGFECGFCGKVLKTEANLIAHMCEKKQRWLNKDDKTTRTAFQVYKAFFEFNYKQKKSVTMEEFLSSRYYGDFMKVGRHILNVNAINPKMFIEFLIKSGLPITQWSSQAVYETYVRELAKKETPEAAVERNLLLMEQWAKQSGEVLTDFFRNVSPALATTWIQSGRISPWVLYAAPSAEDLFARMSEEQLDLVARNIDPKFWGAKFDKHAEDVENIRAVLLGSGF